jgi:hypothetical protein
VLPAVAKLPSWPKIAMLSKGDCTPPADIFTSHTPAKVFFSDDCATRLAGFAANKRETATSPSFIVTITRRKRVRFRIFDS